MSPSLHLAFAIALLFLATSDTASQAAATPGRRGVTLVAVHSQESILSAYLSPKSDPNWGADALRGNQMEKGDKRGLAASGGGCALQLRVELFSNRSAVLDVDVCGASAISAADAMSTLVRPTSRAATTTPILAAHRPAAKAASRCFAPRASAAVDARRGAPILSLSIVLKNDVEASAGSLHASSLTPSRRKLLDSRAQFGPAVDGSFVSGAKRDRLRPTARAALEDIGFIRWPLMRRNLLRAAGMILRARSVREGVWKVPADHAAR
jgi:hypothetical protein